MSDVQEVEVQEVKPVAVAVRKVAPPSLTIRMVNDRASHFYFKRTLAILRSIGKYR
jgi:hypothetical protein